MREALDIHRPLKPVADGIYVLTRHAEDRMAERGVSREAVEAALTYGRLVREDGRQAFVIGRKEVALFAEGCENEEGVDLSAFEGVQVCVADQHVVTVIAECDFKAIRRPRSRRVRRKGRR